MNDRNGRSAVLEPRREPVRVPIEDPRIGRFWAEVGKARSIALASHIDPDGDAIGSLLAMYHVLKGMGKEPVMICRDEAPAHLKFLPGSGEIKTAENLSALKARRYDLFIVLDCSDPVRLGGMAPLMECAEALFVVDHHMDPGSIRGSRIVDERASSTGEILYRMMEQESIAIPREAAYALYVAIMTDTGSFRYGNTSALSFRIASELVRDAKIDVRMIGTEIFTRESLPRLRMRGLVYERAELRDRVIFSYITPDMFEKSGVHSSECEGIIDDLALCREAEIAAIFWLLADGIVRVQLRSIHETDVLEISRALGGGGHRRAAGGRVRGATLEQVRDRVLAAAKAVIST